MYRNLSLAALELSATQSELNELALSYKFRGIEVSIADFTGDAAGDGSYHRKLLESAKLIVGPFRLPIDLDGDDDAFQSGLSATTELCRTAHELGAKRAVTSIAPATDQLPYHENFERHRKRLAELSQTLTPFDLRLGITFDAVAAHREGKAFEFVHEFEPLQLLLSTVGADNVGLVIDVWQLHAAGADPVQTISQQRGESILAVELADAPEDLPAGELKPEARLAPGATNTIDCSGALTALATIGYEGPVTPTPHRSSFSERNREHVVRQVGEALDAVWKEAGLSAAGKLSATT